MDRSSTLLQSRFVKHPLNCSVEQDGVVEIAYLAVEPEMDPGDGRGFEVGDGFAERGAFGFIGKDAIERVEGEREDQEVEGFLCSCGLDSYRGRLRLEIFDGTAEVEFAPADTDVVAGGVVEFGERNGGDAHVAGGGRLHRYADDLRSRGNGDAVEGFTEGADEDGLPELFDSTLRLAVLIKPLLEGAAVIFLFGEGERDQRARDGEFVGGGQERKSQE